MLLTSMDHVNKQQQFRVLQKYTRHPPAGDVAGGHCPGARLQRHAGAAARRLLRQGRIQRWQHIETHSCAWVHLRPHSQRHRAHGRLVT